MHLHRALFYHTSYCIHYFKKCLVYGQAKQAQCKIFILHTGKNVFFFFPLIALKLCKTDMGKKKKKSQLARLLSELIALKSRVGEEPAQNPWSGKKRRDNAATARMWSWRKALRGRNNRGGGEREMFDKRMLVSYQRGASHKLKMRVSGRESAERGVTNASTENTGRPCRGCCLCC